MVGRRKHKWMEKYLLPCHTNWPQHELPWDWAQAFAMRTMHLTIWNTASGFVKCLLFQCLTTYFGYIASKQAQNKNVDDKWVIISLRPYTNIMQYGTPYSGYQNLEGPKIRSFFFEATFLSNLLCGYIKYKRFYKKEA
jgi:hypothetical protein